MTQKLQGKVAVVTGAGSGLGKEIALAMAAEGAKVVVNDIGRDAEGKSVADKVVDAVKKANGTAVASYDSVATMEGGQNIIKTATSNFGRVDALVQCAGNFKAVKTVDVTEEDWESIISVHLKGHFSCIKAAVPEMIKQKTGSIINFSSRAAAVGTASLPYSAAKGGILSMTSMLSAELKQYGINVNVILPSADTPLFPGARPSLGDNMPETISLDPSFTGPVVAFLATDEAKEVTGRYIYTSGGDICLYGRALILPGQQNILVRKPGKWTVEELIQVIPPIAK